MIVIFYLFSFIFIWSEIYTVHNKVRIEKNFLNKDIPATTRMDVIYFLTRFAFFVWIIFGFWTPVSNLFILLFSFNFMKFPLFHINKKLYVIWDNILPAINIVQILLIVITYLSKH